MKKLMFAAPLLAAALVSPLGCGSVGPGGTPQRDGQTGALQLAIDTGGDRHDVTQIHFVVVPRGEPCSFLPVIAEATVPLELETLPPFSPDGGSILPDGGGGDHPFADAFIVLNGGQFNVCATPLTASGDPSSECSQATASVVVFLGGTTEVLLVSQCIGPQNGAIDAVGVLNTSPTITDLTISPTKFIHQRPCDVDPIATLTAEANDPDGDALTFLWQLLGTNLSATGASINFSSFNVGDFQLLLTVTDVFGASTFLQVPIHVSACPADDAGADPDPAAGAANLVAP
jgi:hypothetical protein